MFKKKGTLLLTLSLVLSSLYACGNAETSDSGISTGSTSAPQSAASGTDVSGESPAEASEDKNAANSDEDSSFSDGDIVTIEYYGVNLSGKNDITDVAEAVNAISEKEIGVHVNFNLLDFGSFLQQVSLKMAGNERIDLMNFVPAPPATFSSMTSQNQLMDITGLLEEYAPDALEATGDFIRGTTVGGQIYAVPTISGFSTQVYVIMRKDVLEALGLVEKAENLSSWSEYEEILAAVYEANQNKTLPEELLTPSCLSNADMAGRVYPLQGIRVGSDLWAQNFGVDNLGDTYGIISVDESTDTVQLYYESEDYLNTLKRVQGWYEKGYIYKDAAFTEDSGDTLMANGVTFSFIASGQVGIDATRRSVTGYDVVASQVLSIPMGSSVSQTWGLAIPTTAKEPEAAAKFINLLYSNAEVMNLLTWGIEGRDYTVNEEGEAVIAENPVYTSNMYLWGNGRLTYPTAGLGGDYMERLKKADEEAPVSKYLGFAADTSQLSNELTAINNVINQYRANLESGAVTDLEGEYEKYCQAMEDAGVQKVIDAYQEQLDEWLAQQ